MIIKWKGRGRWGEYPAPVSSQTPHTSPHRRNSNCLVITLTMQRTTVRLLNMRTVLKERRKFKMMIRIQTGR